MFQAVHRSARTITVSEAEPSEPGRLVVGGRAWVV